MNDQRRGPSLSLRRLLFLLIGLGVTAGLLGRWFYRSPFLFLAAVFLLTVVIPYVMAALTLIHVGATERRSRVKWLGCWLLIGPAICTPVLILAPMFLDTSPGRLKNLSTSTILTQRLPNEVDQPWVWDELERRLSVGELTATDADTAVSVLAKHMSTTKPEGWNQPLSWQDDFIAAAFASSSVAPQTRLQLYDAFFSLNPKLETRGRPRAGQSRIPLNLSLSANTWADNSRIPVRVVWWPREFSLGGSPLALADERPRTQRNVFRSNSLEQHYKSVELEIPEPLAEGLLTLEVEFEFAYIDERKLIGLGSGCVDPATWPKSVKRWKETQAIEITVAPAEGTSLTLSTDPSHDPIRNGSIQVGRAVLQSASPGMSRLVLPEFRLTPNPIPLAFKIEAIIGEQRVPLGGIGVTGNRTTSHGSHNVELSTPGADVVTLDLLLTPEPKMLEDKVDVRQIWGKPVEFRGLTLERLDLEAATQVEDTTPAAAE